MFLTGSSLLLMLMVHMLLRRKQEVLIQIAAIIRILERRRHSPFSIVV